MKSLYDISWKVSEEEYRKDPAYSYSTLARFNREGFSKLSSLFDRISSPSLTFGSMVDTLLTDGEEAFNNRFKIVEFPKLSDALVMVAKRLFDEFPDATSISEIDDFDVSRIGIECGYYVSKSYEATRIKNIRRDCEDYFRTLICSQGREIVSQKDYDDCIAAVDALRTSQATEWYFRQDGTDNLERQYQLKFKGSYEDINFRCMMDLCVIDHDKKIVHPCDLKTSSHYEWEFPKSFIQWCYYIQAQLYYELLRQNMAKDDYFKDFKIDDYTFIVVNRNTLTPLAWKFDGTKCIHDIRYGRNNEYLCRNWRGIAFELDKYLKESPRVPEGIFEDKPNDITEYLNNQP